MKLGLLLLAFLSTTELLGTKFQYAGHLRSRSLELIKSGNFVFDRIHKPVSEINLRKLRGREIPRAMIFDYELHLVNNGRAESLLISRWMVDIRTLDVLHINDSLNKEIRETYIEEIPSEKKEVIGRRFENLDGGNPFGAPLLIETSDTKLIITMNEETSVMTIHGEKTLEDGQFITWKDEFLVDL